MKNGCSVSRPLLLGRAFIKIFWLAENTCSSYSETQNILLLMTLGVCSPSVGGGEGREMGSSGKVVVSLSHKKVVSFHFRLTSVPSC